MPARSTRAGRIAEQIQKDLSDILATEVADPRLESVTITRVRMSGDLNNATVLFTVSGGEASERELSVALRHAAGFLRSELAQRLQARLTPRLVFHVDRGRKSSERIEKLFARMKKRTKTLSLPAILALSLTLGTGVALRAYKRPLERYEASFSVMGTVFTVVAYGEKKGFLASAVQIAFDESERIDQLLSNYKPESELSRINANGAGRPLVISREMAELLETCLDYSRRSEGAFDITVGPLMRVWGFYRGSGKLPSSRAVEQSRKLVGYQNVELDLNKPSVRLRRLGVELDPGGVGKGYAVDRMAAKMRRAGLGSYFISAGSSSIYASGHPPQEPRGWHVRIRDPKDSGSAVEHLYLKNQALSTSGAYEKFFELEGKTYSHIMDPRTGWPASGVVSVSVLADRTLHSEAWATALFVNGPDWAAARGPADLRIHFCLAVGGCAWIPSRD